MSGAGVRFPEGFRLEALRRDHPRKRFRSGQPEVDEWLAARALQHQDKHLSASRVLLDGPGAIAGYFTLATGQVDFSELPDEIVRRLPRRQLPVAVLAWLGVDRAFQGRGLGRLLLAQALRDCHEAGRTFAFVAVILDCVDDAAKAFYRRYDFREVPGHPYRLFLSAQQLDAMMTVGPSS
jgi:ribosomal protein S18 acetylase RimI-like enzyme